MTGILKLAHGLRCGMSAPNAQLRRSIPTSKAPCQVLGLGFQHFRIRCWPLTSDVEGLVLSVTAAQSPMVLSNNAEKVQLLNYLLLRTIGTSLLGAKSSPNKWVFSMGAEPGIYCCTEGVGCRTVIEWQPTTATQVIIAGAGLAGLHFAASFVQVEVNSLAVLEKSSTARTWRHHGNAFSRVNSSEPYRMPVSHDRLTRTIATIAKFSRYSAHH